MEWGSGPREYWGSVHQATCLKMMREGLNAEGGSDELERVKSLQ